MTVCNSIPLLTFTTKVPLKNYFRRIENPVSPRNSKPSFQTFSTAMSELNLRSSRDGKFRKSYETERDGRESPKIRLEAQSSSHNANPTLKNDTVKYNKIRIQDLLCDDSPPEKPRAFLCTRNNCNKTFLSKKDLEIHQESVHAPRTTHICPVCSASFARKRNVKIHVSYTHPLYKILVVVC